MKQFGVIVIGGGHAGVEAASVVARMGITTALITFKKDDIGTMSCNPAIGGIGKGHLVREIDALDGVMAVAADRSAIQYRLLNSRKGPAVRGPRAQIDRALYRKAVQGILYEHENLTIIEAEVSGLIFSSDSVTGVTLSCGKQLFSNGVILTAGTFLNGVIHIGHNKTKGGRMGDSPSKLLADQLIDLGLPRGRLKTGTPPRLNGKTINWDILEIQRGDDNPTRLSFMPTIQKIPQISCGITHTNQNTHDIIIENISKSALYGGEISGVGPRYCPSIEDKVVRFADKDSHQIFLEPESLSNNIIYPNGISSSLPLNVQELYVRSIKGLESCEIIQPAYAIEYDYFNPKSLKSDLEVSSVANLYFAGQINGTTGYEEAAAQGIVAGIGAVSKILNLEKIEFNRNTSYIGVLVDDLIKKGVTEPYRMFTSRAERRLYLRADNADQRLTPLGVNFGFVSIKRRKHFDSKIASLNEIKNILVISDVGTSDLLDEGIFVSGDRKTINLLEVVKRYRPSLSSLLHVLPKISDFDEDLVNQIINDFTYENYIDRQDREDRRLLVREDVIVNEDCDFSLIKGLSGELKHKVVLKKPKTFGEIKDIEGMTPAALSVLYSYIKNY